MGKRVPRKNERSDPQVKQWYVKKGEEFAEGLIAGRAQILTDVLYDIAAQNRALPERPTDRHIRTWFMRGCDSRLAQYRIVGILKGKI